MQIRPSTPATSRPYSAAVGASAIRTTFAANNESQTRWRASPPRIEVADRRIESASATSRSILCVGAGIGVGRVGDDQQIDATRMAKNIAAPIRGEDLMNYSIPLVCTIRPRNRRRPTIVRPPHAILLDVGDTILRQHWFDLSLGIAAVVHDRARPEELATAFRAYELPAYARGDECLLAEWLRLRVPSLAELSTEAIEDRIWAAVVRMEPLPRVDQVLASLAADRVSIGAVSNAAFSGRAIRAELERHGLATQLQFVLSSADLRIRKPAPGIYSAALERLRARASRRGSSATHTTRISSARPRSACSRFGLRRAVR